jgi:hypothetical protein
MQKFLVTLGIAILLTGLLWPWLGKLPLGRLPGDIVIERPSLRIYFPLTSMLLLSALLSALIWLFRR